MSDHSKLSATLSDAFTHFFTQIRNFSETRDIQTEKDTT